VTASTVRRRFVGLRALRWLPYGLSMPFLVLLPLSRGLDVADVGVVWMTHGLVVAVLELPTGALADVVGRRRTLLAGAVLTAASMVGYAVASGLGGFLAAIALMAAGRALVSGSLEAWYVDALRAAEPGASLRAGLSWGGAADGLALAGGSLLGGVIPLLAGGLPARGEAALLVFSPPLLVAAGVALAYGVAVAVLVREPPRRRERAGLAAAGHELRAVAVEASGYARSSRAVRRLLVVSAIAGLSFTAVELLWQPRLADLAGGAADQTVLFGAVSAAVWLALALGSALSPLAARVRGVRWGYAGTVAASALLLAALAAAGSPLMFVVLYVLVYAAGGVAEPLHLELLHESVGAKARATVLSAESLATQLGGAVANLGLSRLADGRGIGAAWAVAAAALFAAALVARAVPLAPRAAPKPPPAPEAEAAAVADRALA
jgi:hypothetical protein